MTRILALGLTLALGAQTAQATEIGAVGAVNPRTTGQPPAAAPRQLEIADNVVVNERIEAGPDGAAQILLVDQTTITVGPNSSLVLDRFVYDPDRDAGDMSLTLARGALRFIGGRVTKSSDATIAVGDATIGLRGAVAHVTASESGAEVLFFAGERARITIGNELLTITRPGGTASIDFTQPPGAQLSFNGVAGGEQVADAMRSTRSPQQRAQRFGLVSLDKAGVAGSERTGAPQASPISTIGEVALRDTPPPPHFTGFVGNAAFDAAQSSIYSDPSIAPVSMTPSGPEIDIGSFSAFLPISFNLFDSGALEDGDVVSLVVRDGGGVVIGPENVTLTLGGRVFEPRLEPGPVRIEITAVDLGTAPPTTGGIEALSEVIVDGSPVARFNLQIGETGVVSGTAIAPPEAE